MLLVGLIHLKIYTEKIKINEWKINQEEKRNDEIDESGVTKCHYWDKPHNDYKNKKYMMTFIFKFVIYVYI